MGRLPLGRFTILGLTIEFILWPPARSTAWNWVHRPRLAFWDRLFLAKWQKKWQKSEFSSQTCGGSGPFWWVIRASWVLFWEVFWHVCHYLSFFVIFWAPSKRSWPEKWLKWVIKAEMTDFAFFLYMSWNKHARIMCKLFLNDETTVYDFLREGQRHSKNTWTVHAHY